MDNLPPGVSWSDLEPREHDRRCATLCECIAHPLDVDVALELFMNLVADISWWRPEHGGVVGVDVVTDIQRRLNEAAAHVECLEGHRSHRCNCEDLSPDVDEGG